LQDSNNAYRHTPPHIRGGFVCMQISISMHCTQRYSH
jgi:hypothetical protein